MPAHRKRPAVIEEDQFIICCLDKTLNLHPLSLLRLLFYRITAFTVTDIPRAKPGNSMFCSSVRRERIPTSNLFDRKDCLYTSFLFVRCISRTSRKLRVVARAVFASVPLDQYAYCYCNAVYKSRNLPWANVAFSCCIFQEEY